MRLLPQRKANNQQVAPRCLLLIFILFIFSPSSFSPRFPFNEFSSKLKFSVTKFLGAIIRSRCVAGIQTSKSHGSQVDHPTLLTVQGGMGLAHSFSRDVYSNFHTIRCRISPQRAEPESNHKEECTVW